MSPSTQSAPTKTKQGCKNVKMHIRADIEHARSRFFSQHSPTGEQSMHEKVTCPVVATTCPLCGMTVRRTYFSIHAGYECKMRIRVPSPR